MKIAVLLVTVSVMLSGCASTNNEGMGTLLGTVAGGILGNQVGGGRGQSVATIAGAAIGAYAGSAVGARMDEVDRMKMSQAHMDSLENNRIGESTSWSNPDSGSSGSVSPVRTYQDTVGQYCRDFQQEITVDGQTERGTGTACRQPDGTWRIVGG